MDPLTIARRLRDDVNELDFRAPVTHVYNPLDYAWRGHRQYIQRYGREPREVVLLGMNPGPWGMAQTGVPFGDVPMVRDWMGVEASVDQPDRAHPKRPVHGFDCRRREGSGRRLWGWAAERFGTAERFFARFFVANYCPLCFFDAEGRNLTPDKLRAGEREPLTNACDTALRRLVDALEPHWVLGVGRFAEQRARDALADRDVRIGTILHPSPASPAANRGWSSQIERQLADLGIRLPHSNSKIENRKS